MKNLKQLVAFITGKETRIGYPNEHLGSDSKDLVVSPMYSTGVGLVLKGFEYKLSDLTTDSSENDENNIEDYTEVDNNGGIIDKIKDWFTEDNDY